MATAPDTLPARIVAAFRERLKSDTIVDVTPSGIRDNLHVLVVSRELDNMSEQEKQEFLWSVLDEATRSGKWTAEEMQRVALILPVSLDELKR